MMLRLIRNTFQYSQMQTKVSYINQITAQKLDEDLMSEEVGFTLDILMELAGQSVANTVALIDQEKKMKNVVVLVGPGNNGGDGIVSARHLSMLGYVVSLVLFKPTNKPFFQRLINTCKYNNIKFTDYSQELLDTQDLIVDSMLGFSYTPPLREPYATAIHGLKKTKTPILSVDIPSGWNVEQGNQEDLFVPQYNLIYIKRYLISLTVPKLGVQDFKGRHFLGGRFVPVQIKDKWQLVIPEYKGTDTVLEL